jgi:hypothetical protein
MRCETRVSRVAELAAATILLFACLPIAHADDPCFPEIYGWAVEDTILVAHQGAYYNCCAVVAVSMQLPEPFVVDFLEEETFPVGPCYCECCFDIDMWAGGFSPGTYQVRVWNQDHTVLFGQVEVQVSEPPEGPPTFAGSWQTECLEASEVGEEDPIAPPDASSTWGAVKGLFR